MVHPHPFVNPFQEAATEYLKDRKRGIEALHVASIVWTMQQQTSDETLKRAKHHIPIPTNRITLPLPFKI